MFSMITKLAFRDIAQNKLLVILIPVFLLFAASALYCIEPHYGSNPSDETDPPKSYDYLLFPDSGPSINDVLWDIQTRFDNDEKNNFTVLLANGTYNMPLYWIFWNDSSLFSDLFIEIRGLGISVQLPGDNLIGIDSGNLHCKIVNLSMSGGSRGIEAYTDLATNAITFLELQNCRIFDNISSYWGNQTCMDGTGVYANGPTVIRECDIYNNIGYNWVSPAYNNCSRGGGIAIVNNTPYKTEISGSNIYGNEANAGGGIFVSGSAPVSIIGNRIADNTRKFYVGQGGIVYQAGFGEGVYCLECDDLTFSKNIVTGQIPGSADYRDIIPVSSAVVVESCAYSQSANSIIIENNSFMDNNDCHGLWLMMPEGGTLIRNNLSCGNNFGIYLSGYSDGYITLKYNNAHGNGTLNNEVQNYFITHPNAIVSSHNYELDPQVNASYAPLWDSSVISWLIDGGDPELEDPDGTPSDIGAIRAVDHRYWEYSFENQADRERWYWVSYPVLNTFTNNALKASVFFEELLHVHQKIVNGLPVDQPTYLDRIDWMEEGNPLSLEWLDDELEWTPNQHSHFVFSPQGYKIKLQLRNNPAFPWPVTLTESGFKTRDNLQFPIYGGVENWLGYFKEDAQYPDEAFAVIWDDINMVRGKNWSLTRNSNGEMVGKKGTLNYGDMVIVTTNSNHSFRWGSGIPVPPRIKEASESFIYDEKPDYIPVYLNIPDDMMMDLCEIGLYVDGVCKGAVVVDGPFEQVSAYVDSPDELSGDDVEFVFCYEEAKRAGNELRAMNLNPGRLQPQYGIAGASYPYFEIKITQDDMEKTVPPEFSLRQNYPNPFNPSTTISYSLPEMARVRLDIYNLKGQLVKTLIDSEMEAGLHSVVWNGKDSNNQAVASGVYFYRISSPNNTQTKRMLLMK